MRPLVLAPALAAALLPGLARARSLDCAALRGARVAAASIGLATRGARVRRRHP
jgi:hypothetical protein